METMPDTPPQYRQHQPRNPNYKSFVEQKMEGQHFMHLLGMHLTTIEPGYIEAALDLDQKHMQQDGKVHGGVIATISDISMGFAAFTLVEADQRVVSSEVRIAFLNPGIGERLQSRGYVIKAGKRLHYCEAEIYIVHRGQEKLIAKSSSMMAVFRPGEA